MSCFVPGPRPKDIQFTVMYDKEKQQQKQKYLPIISDDQLIN